MDNLDQRNDVSASKQNAKDSSVNREQFRQFRQVKDEKDQRYMKRIRKKMVKRERRQTNLNATSVQHHRPQNFQRQIPPDYYHPSPERFERNQFSKQIDNRPNTSYTTRRDYDYDYDNRSRNDSYMTRRQNYAQPSRVSGLRRDRYIRNRHFDKWRSRPSYSNHNRPNDRSSSRRQYNRSLSPIHRRILSESPGPTRSPGPTSSIKEPIIRINTQYASKSYLGKADVTVSLKDPPPKLLVLDLNGTLVYRDNAKRDIILRPYMERFMRYIFDSSNSFAVMVWSSAQPKNVDKMVRAAFGSYEKKLVAKWTRNHLNLSDQDYYQKVETIKDLEKVWQELNKNKSTTFPQIVWDQTNTILIDDSSVKAKLQPFNAIHLPDFDNERCKSRKDRELYNVIDYLGKLHNQSNVSAYIKKFPYTSPNDNKE